MEPQNDIISSDECDQAIACAIDVSDMFNINGPSQSAAYYLKPLEKSGNNVLL